MNIAELSIKRPSLIIVIFAVLTFLGIVSYKQLNYELLPKYSEPVLVVTTLYPGASPSEVENSVTRRIEDAVASLEDMDNIQSTSFEGYSVCVLIFKSTADMDVAVEEARARVMNIRSLLPEEAMDPSVSQFAMSDLPVMRLGVTANMPSTELYDLVKQKIQPVLARVDGVAQVSLVGGEEREVRVLVDPQQLEKYNLSILQINQAVYSSNMDFPTGKVKNPDGQYMIRLSGKYSSVEDLRNTVVATAANGEPVKVKDVAEVFDTKREIALLNRIDGQNSIGLLIMKQLDGNEVKISEGIKKEIAASEKLHQKEQLKFSIANDASDFTLASANAVIHDLLLAIVLVALVMLVFLHSLRNSLIVMVAIPASLISTFIGMYLFNFSLNLISLVAMSLVIGILVDDSIVVLENIYRHLQLGKDRKQASIEGRNEINYTALSITLVDVVVFLPIAIITSMISGMLRQFALVVVFSTLMSLFVSFTITPLLASRMAKVEKFRPGSLMQRIIDGFENWLSRITEGYARILGWSFRHKRRVLIGTTLLFFLSIALLGGGFIGSEFVTLGDRGEIIIQMELPRDATVEQTNRAVLKAEHMIRQKKEVVRVFSTIGGGNGFFEGNSTAYKAEMNVKLVDKEQRELSSDRYAEQLKKELTLALPGVKVRSGIVSLIGTSDMAPIQLVLQGTDLDSVEKYARMVEAEMKKVPGTAEVKLSVESGNPEIKVQIDREQMNRLGLSMAVVGATMQSAYSGNRDTKLRDGVNEYDINILLDEFDRKSIEDVRNLSFLNNQGQMIRLEQFAEISPSTGTVSLQRYNRVSSITVTSQVIGRSVGTVGQDILSKIETVHIPPTITLTPEGDLKYQAEAFGSMGIAFLASILFVYLIMVALYDSFLYPFVVLFSIPLAIIGALFALALAKESLSIFSILGIIMLVGLVGKNAILLVDFTNKLRSEGYGILRALITAGKVRLRPILMTTFSMIVGMMPIALASGSASEAKNGMAWALIGGLTSSLFLSLVVVPVMYLIMDRAVEKVKRWWYRRRGLALAQA